MLANSCKRLFSLLLALVMVFSMVPFQAFAAETGEDTHDHSDHTHEQDQEVPPSDEEGAAKPEDSSAVEIGSELLQQLHGMAADYVEQFKLASDMTNEQMLVHYLGLRGKDAQAAWEKYEAGVLLAVDLSAEELELLLADENAQLAQRFYSSFSHLYKPVMVAAASDVTYTPATGISVKVSGNVYSDSFADGVLTVVAEGTTSGSGCNKKDVAGTATITVTNSSSYPATLSFSWESGDGVASVTIGDSSVENSGSREVEVAGNKTVVIKVTTSGVGTAATANFTVSGFGAKGTVTFEENFNGSYTVNGVATPTSFTDAIGTEYELVAFPDEGYVLRGWFAGDTELGKGSPFKYKNDGKVTVTPVFIEDTLTVEFGAPVGNGSYTVNGEAAPVSKAEPTGTSYALVATPNSEKNAFVAWYVNGQKYSENATITLTTGVEILEDSTIYAEFRDLTAYNFSLAYDDGLGRVELGGVWGSVCYEATEVTLTAAPAAGATFLGWTDANGKVVSTANPYKFTPTADVSLKAAFSSPNSAAWFKVDKTFLINDLNAAAAAGTEIVLAADGTLPAGDFTIPSGDTLLIPYDAAGTVITTEPERQAGQNTAPAVPSAFRTLHMAKGANVRIEGAMSVPAKVYAAGGSKLGSGTPYGTYGYVKMAEGSSITVANGGGLYCYGYINGSGTVTAESGSVVYESFLYEDFRGGSQMSEMVEGGDVAYSRVFPMNCYSVQNILVPLTLKAGAVEYGYACMTVSFIVELPVGSAIAFIGGEGAMFYLKSGTVTKRYDYPTDRLILTADADIEVNGINMSVYTYKVNSSDYDLPINGNMTININSGSIALNQNVVLLPGVEMNVAKGASCSVSNGASLYVFDVDEWGNYVGSQNAKMYPVWYVPERQYTRTEADLKDAQVNIAGSVSAGAGFAYTTAGGAAITGTEGATVSLKLGADGGKNYQMIQGTGVVEFSVANGLLTTARLRNADGSTTNPEDEINPTVGTTYTYTNGKWVPSCTMTIDENDQAVEHCVPNHTGEVTCNNPRLCKYCGKVMESVDHTPGAEATCTTDQICTVEGCGFVLKEKLGHVELTVPGTAATCHSTGLTEGKTCNRCGDTLVEQTVIEMLPHTWSSGTQTKAPTCTEKGTVEYFCTVCSGAGITETKTEDVNALGHNMFVVDGQAATCLKAGVKEHYVCDRDDCGLMFWDYAGTDPLEEGETTVIPQLVHEYVTTVTKTPTCTELGSQTTACTHGCGIGTVVEELPKLEHDIVVDAAKAPTCTETGLTEGSHCTTCDTMTDAQVVIPALGHDWDDAEYTWTEDNSQCTYTRSCTNENCDAVDTQTVNTTANAEKAPTCTENGGTTYTADFDNTDSNIKDQTKNVVVTALGHDYSEVTYSWTELAGKQYCEASRSCQNDGCTVTEFEQKAAESVTIDSTCDVPGKTVYTVVFENTNLGSDTKEVEISAKGHVWGDISYTWSEDKSTCTAKRVCTVDGTHVDEETVDVVVTTVAATCKATGLTTYTATFTNSAFEKQEETAVLEKLPHQEEVIPGKAATCTATGLTDGKKCSACDEILEAQTVIAMKNHEIVVLDAVAATCTADGKTAGQYCTTCDTQTVEQVVIRAPGHKWDDAEYTWSQDNSQCTYTRSCTNENCDAVDTQTVNTTANVEKAPTCTENGGTTYTADFDNTDSNIKDQTKNVVVTALGHDFGEVTYAWEELAGHQFCTATRSCQRENCGVTETEEKEATAETIDSTCGAVGKTVYTAVFENKGLGTATKEVEIDKKNHTWGEISYTWSEDKSTCTAKRVCTADESHVEEETVNADSVTTAVATCLESGLITHTATFTNSAFEKQTETTVVEKLPHEMTETSAVEPTCTEDGTNGYYTCGTCNLVYKDEAGTEQTTVEAEFLKALGHQYDDGVITLAPTCLEEGVKTFTCQNSCGDSYTEKLDALNHNYDAGQVTTKATCTTDGVMTYTCQNDCCTEETENHSYTEIIVATGHKWATVGGRPATCTTPGWTGEAICFNCFATTEGEEIPVIDHTWGEGVVTKQATCQSEGEMTQTCTMCAVATKVTVLPKAAHSTNKVAAKAPTCTAEGNVEYYTCATCSSYFEDVDGTKIIVTVVIPALGHDTYQVNAVDPTCTKPGNHAYWVCETCDGIFKDEAGTENTTVEAQVIDALGHDYTPAVTDPTCVESGYTTYSCVRGDHTYVDNFVDPTGHTAERIHGKDATCTGVGLTDGQKCSVCDEILVKQEIIPAKGHTAGEAVKQNEIPATCTEDGSYEEVVFCSVCGTEISREKHTVPATGHTEETIPAVAPTCTATGKTEGVKCSVCGTVLEKQETIPATGHTKVTDAAVDATCTETGLTAGEHCSVCNEVLVAQKVVPATGHTKATDAAVDATCTETGLTAGEHCSVCNTVLVEQEVVPATGHTEVTDEAVAATCTETGLTAGEHCSVCNEVLVEQEVVPATGHTEETIPGKDATCTGVGLTDGQKCSVCDKILVEQEIIPAKGHTAGEAVKQNEIPATCTEDGSYEEVVFCSVCGTEISREKKTVPATGHTEEILPAVAPTCTATGKTEGVKCSVCNTVLEKQETVSATGHTEVIDAAVAATCTATGLSEGKHCSVCNTVLVAQKEVAAKGHVKVADPAVAATCTTDGKTAGEHCSVCNEILVAQEVIPATGHTRVTDAAVEATCTTAGKKAGEHCSVCNEILIAQEVIPATGHTKVTDAAVAATCTETGLTAGEHCSVCNTVLVKQEVVPATGHKEAIDKAVAATCTESGLKEGKHCPVCNTVLVAQEIVPATGHTEVTDEAVASTCLKTGLTEGKHCSVCNEVLVAQEEIAKLEHKWDDGRVTTLPDCENEGVRTFTCDLCNGTKTGAEPALGHDAVHHEGKQPSYTTPGWEPYETCTRCDHNTMVAIPALGEAEITSFDEFLENLAILENIADTYVKKVAPGKDPAMLIIKYIRTGVDRYNSGSWNIMAGYEDSDFAEYVRKYEEEYNANRPEGEPMMKVSGLKNIHEFNLPNGDLADIGHVFGSMDITYTNKTSEDHADVSGWAGDTVDLMSMVDQFGLESTDLEGMVEEITKKYFLKYREDFEEEPIEGTFSNTDVEGDLDAFYVMQTLYGREYTNGTLTDIFSSYMTESLTSQQRAKFFLNNRLDGVSLRSDIRDTVYNEVIANGVVMTLEGTRPFQTENLTDLRKACCYVFADYLCRLAGDFVEVQENKYYSVFQTETSTLAPGIVQKISYANTADGKTMVFYLATGDITQGNVHVYANYNNNDPAAGWAMQRVIDQANVAQQKYGNPESEHYIENYNVIASINGAGYDMYTGEPSGILVMNGVVYHPIEASGFFGILDDGTAMIGSMKQYMDLQAERSGRVQEAIATFGDLIRDGKVVAVEDGDRASRTAVGITATGKVVFMVLDGRQGDLSCGGNMREIAQIMLEAGCVYAVNLDGGGSSTYVAKQPGSDELTVVSKPSDGISRSVSTSLLMVSTAPDSSAFDRAVIESEYSYFTVGASDVFTATAISATGNVVDMPEGVVWTVSDESVGSITADGMFTAKANGSAQIRLTLDGAVIGFKNIHVVDPDNVYFEKASINAIYGEPVTLPVKVAYEGKAVAFTPDDVVLSVADAKHGTIDGFTFTGNEDSGLRTIKVTASLACDPTITGTISLSMYTKDEASFDFDHVDGGDRQLAWIREVTNAIKQSSSVYNSIDKELPMDTYYTFAMDMSQIELPAQLADLTYMLPGADVEGNNTAWSFLLQLAERISVLTEVTPVLFFDKNLDVDYSELSINNEYFYLKEAIFNEEQNSLTLVMKWHRQEKPIDIDAANPLCVVTGLKLTPKEDAAWTSNDSLVILNSGYIAYDVYLRANALYSFSSKPENQEIYGLYPFQNVRDDGVQENGGHFQSIYREFEDQYTLFNGIKDGWVVEGGGFAYYENGEKYTGIREIDGYYYDFGEQGVNIGQKKYTGEMVDENGNEYYLVDGVKYSGWMIKDMKDVKYYNPETFIREKLTADEVPSTCIIDGYCVYTSESGAVKRIDYDDAGGHEYVEQADGSNICSVCGHLRYEMEKTIVTLSTYIYTYNGKARKPDTTVVYPDGRVLTKPGEVSHPDYGREWGNNVDVGTAYVKLTAAKYGKYSNLNTWRGNAAGSITVNYEIRPDLPTNIQMVEVNNTAVISWKAAMAPGVTYVIYSSEDGKTWVEVGETEGLSYVMPLSSAQGKSFRIGTYKVVDGKTYESVKKTGTFSVTITTLTVVTGANEEGKPTLKWNVLDGATKFVVYRSNAKDGKYTAVFTTAGKTYTHASAVDGNTYYYYVKAIMSDGREVDSEIVSCTYNVPGNEEQKPFDDVVRVFGATRYDTAFAAADMMKELQGVEKFQTIVVASGIDFADALSGSYLANQKNAPIILVRNRDQEIEQVKEYIRKNLAAGGTVYILGGTKAVPASMESGLEGFNVKRLGGGDRYETNLLILKEAGVNRGDDILICTGTNFADSLSASAVNKAILLVKDNLYGSQKNFLNSVRGGNIYVIGGKVAVSEKLAGELAAYGTVRRIDGATRYETSVNVAKTFFADAEHVVIAYGNNFPDGLSGGPLAYALGAPLILTADGKDGVAASYTAEAKIDSGVVLGGTGLISDNVVRKICQMDNNAKIPVK